MNTEIHPTMIDSVSSKTAQWKNTSKTQSEWNTIWLNKFERTAQKEEISEEKCKIMRHIIVSYLDKNPSNPYYIGLNKLKEFLNSADTAKTDALRYFYEKVAISPSHQKMIEKSTISLNQPTVNDVDVEKDQLKTSDTKRPADFQSDGEKSTSPNTVYRTIERSPEIDQKTHCQKERPLELKERITLLNKLKLEINARNYSNCTLSNYIGAVTRFMNRLTPESSSDWSAAFKEHLVWLRDDQRLAPNTINQYAASIAFFMEEVLEIEPGADILIRMKTGKPLPRVHSLEYFDKNQSSVT